MFIRAIAVPLPVKGRQGEIMGSVTLHGPYHGPILGTLSTGFSELGH